MTGVGAKCPNTFGLSLLVRGGKQETRNKVTFLCTPYFMT
jgi:hypothetical protein